MDTKVYKIDQNNIDEKLLIEAGEVIKLGGLVVFPTETVYGLGADALNEEAVKKIYMAKGRPSDNPLIMHVSDIDMVEKSALYIGDNGWKLMEKFWPGPLTIILKKKDIVPDIITGGLDTVAFRFPDHEIALKLIEKAGTPIAAPSANISGRPSPTIASHVVEDLYGKVDMILDGGDTVHGIESTIVDLSIDGVVEILRPGAITKEMIEEVLVDVKSIDEDKIKGAPKSPGLKYKHYAPKADTYLVVGEPIDISKEIKSRVNDKSTAIMITEESKKFYTKIDNIYIMGSRENPSTIAHNIYSILRQVDMDNCKTLYIEGIENSGIGEAIMNRLKKASGYNIVKA